MKETLLEQVPALRAPLDPGFRPAALGNRAFRKAVRESGEGCLSPSRSSAMEQNGRSTGPTCFAPDHELASLNFPYCERLLKFLLWQKGAFRVTVSGADDIAAQLATTYAPGGERAFDAQFSAKVYDQPAFLVERSSLAEAPSENEKASAVGGHLAGCRIGFDAGGSDRKVAAVIDGKEVFSCEVVWDPKTQSDPQYHVDGIDDCNPARRRTPPPHRRHRRELGRNLCQQPYHGGLALPEGAR